MRKTKIICTLGPGTDSEPVLHDLFRNGMNVARLNFSHGTHEEHLKRIKIFKKIRKELGLPVGLLIDTKGPEIRLKKFEDGKIELVDGDTFTLTIEDVPGNKEIVSVTYEKLPDDVSKGDRILIDDGLIELKVMSKTKMKIICEVINGGEVSDRKGVNVPGVYINLPFLSDRDKNDILFAIENGFDLLAASFVRCYNDIKQIKDFLEDNGGEDIKIVAKIENRDGVDNVDEIIRISDGIMVARGDMGVEIPFEELPSIQKYIILKCNQAGIPVITATQMLDSMIRNPRPTRAEITDIANAIYDGTSALMLSGETSIGEYPVEAVKTMAKIALKTEQNINYLERFDNTHITISNNVTNAISHATCTTAHSLQGSAIVTVTKSGHTARMVSKYRPACPIIATTVEERVFHQLAMSWGVYPIMTERKKTTDEIFHQAIEESTKAGLAKNGDLIVITGGMLVDISGTTNTIKVHVIGDVLLQGKGINHLTATGILCILTDKNKGLHHFNSGDIVVIHKTTDDILPILKNATAIITEEDSEDSKAVVVGKTLEIPVITNAVNATEILKSGTVATVSAGEGLVYSGVKE